MQVRVISLNDPSTKLMRIMRTVSTDVAVQPGIDVRKVSSESLVKSNVISLSAAHAIDYGRKWHHEMPSKGAIGLAIANRLALAADITVPLLLLEDDCVISNPEVFRQEVKSLLDHIEDFDMAVFGASLQYNPKDVLQVPPGMSANWIVASDRFFCLHCVLYSPHGRQIVSEYLRDHALDMQIDSLYGDLAKMGMLRVWAQYKDHSATQSIHFSSIQDKCLLCDLSPLGVSLSRSSCRTIALCTLGSCTLAWILARLCHERKIA